jgi:hypothetical protein
LVVSVSLLALVSCAPGVSLAPAPLGGTQSAAARARASTPHPQRATLSWSPTHMKLKDGGPYAASTLSYTYGDTVSVNYDVQCNYQVDYDLHPGPVKNGIESDVYNFYAYTGPVPQPPYHCTVQAQLKDSGGHVVAHAGLHVTILYPKHHPHGG